MSLPLWEWCRVFIVMVKRGNENINPRGATLLLEGDVVLLLGKVKWDIGILHKMEVSSC
ncbi:MAG: hypothetical protein HFG25_10065 [Lachnospiraceae bacterium]|nr:hypothetical protein [Lachnospiraceae bacterium]